MTENNPRVEEEPAVTLSELDLLAMIIGAVNAPIEDDPIGKLPEMVTFRIPK